MRSTSANTQPAAVAYSPRDGAAGRCTRTRCSTSAEDGIARVTVFYDHPMLRRLGIVVTEDDAGAGRSV